MPCIINVGIIILNIFFCAETLLRHYWVKWQMLQKCRVTYRVKCTILHPKWTLLKPCCFSLILLRSIINLAHDFKSSFLIKRFLWIRAVSYVFWWNYFKAFSPKNDLPAMIDPLVQVALFDWSMENPRWSWRTTVNMAFIKYKLPP